MGRRGKRRNLARTGGVLAVALSAVLLAGPAEASHLFEPAERFRVATWLGSAAIGDVTADGRNDVLVTGSAGDNRLFVFPQSAEGPLEPARIYHFDGYRGSDWTGVELVI